MTAVLQAGCAGACARHPSFGPIAAQLAEWAHNPSSGEGDRNLSYQDHTAKEHSSMVLPLFIVGTVGAGVATGYGMYQAGTALALPASVNEAPPKTASSLAAGGITAVAAYSAQGRVLNRYLAHLLTYEVPKNVTAWSFRDFMRIAGPLVAPRAVMFSTSVALMGFVSTKVDLSRDEK